MVRTRLKLAATLTVVVLALTGFHTGKGGHGSGGGSGKSKSGKSRSHSGSDDDSGGGCSSDEKSNDDYDGSGGSTATASPSPSRAGAEVVVVDCVKPGRRKGKGKPARAADTTATLRITSKGAYTGTYRVTLEFKGATGSAVDSAETVVTVGGGETKTFEIAMKTPKAVDKVRNCWVYDVREQDATATPTASGGPSSAP
ncbi:hypothetical protein ACFVZH_27325 [Streptomyces sp. NPDC059534]|uniref:hypothetical protein n=1 Tax=Streptomyces sp. NPDC059534 TaxID=3346859 RepID=UPI0036928DA7